MIFPSSKNGGNTTETTNTSAYFQKRKIGAAVSKGNHCSTIKSRSSNSIISGSVGSSATTASLSTIRSLGLQLYNFSAEIECSLGHADRVDHLVLEILSNTTILLQDQLRAYETRILSLSARNEFQESGSTRLSYSQTAQ